jgi:hypothetical protein
MDLFDQVLYRLPSQLSGNVRAHIHIDPGDEKMALRRYQTCNVPETPSGFRVLLWYTAEYDPFSRSCWLGRR